MAQSTSDETIDYPPSQRRTATAAHSLNVRRLEDSQRRLIGRVPSSGKIHEVPGQLAVLAAARRSTSSRCRGSKRVRSCNRFKSSFFAHWGRPP